MNGKAFLDTNVLVYAYDYRDPLKQAKAQKLISDGIRGDDLALSVQVLEEFFKYSGQNCAGFRFVRA